MLLALLFEGARGGWAIEVEVEGVALKVGADPLARSLSVKRGPKRWALELN